MFQVEVSGKLRGADEIALSLRHSDARAKRDRRNLLSPRRWSGGGVPILSDSCVHHFHRGHPKGRSNHERLLRKPSRLAYHTDLPSEKSGLRAAWERVCVSLPLKSNFARTDPGHHADNN